jgi:parvulin-like peptidyl-prolyl isomerase
MSLLLRAIGLAAVLAVAPATTLCQPSLAADVFAQGADISISTAEYSMALRTAARGKFYHGNPSDRELAKLQREVGDRVVADALLAREALRRGFAADEASIRREVDAVAARLREQGAAAQGGDRFLAALERRMRQESLLAQLEHAVRATPEPSEGQLSAYYAANLDKFTAPEQVRLSMILLAVDPSSPTAVWDAARAEGARIARRLRGGADFAELARMHSRDATSTKGGALGYVHRGMLPDPAQEAVDRLRPGEISDPVVLLEGVAVLRLDERKESARNPLPAVRERAAGLWKREQSDAAWNGLVARLRAQTPLTINEAVYLPVPGPTAAK